MYLLIIGHDAELAHPEVDADLAESVCQSAAVTIETCRGIIGMSGSEHWSVRPVGVSGMYVRYVGQIAHVCVSGVGIPKTLYLVSPLPVCLIYTQHASQVARLVDDDLCVELALKQFGAQQSSHTCYLSVCGWCAFLFGSLPVPMAIGFVDGTDIVKLYAVFLLCPGHHVCHVDGKVVVCVGAQIECAAASRVGGKSILGEMDGGRVEEGEEGGHTSFLGKLKEASLPLLTVEIFGTGIAVDLSTVSLRSTAGSCIESPDAESYAFVLRKEPVCHLCLQGIVPASYLPHAPSVARTKAIDGLPLSLRELISSNYCILC